MGLIRPDIVLRLPSGLVFMCCNAVREDAIAVGHTVEWGVFWGFRAAGDYNNRNTLHLDVQDVHGGGG